MNKCQDEFLDHFARLGVFSKVQVLMESGGDTDVKSQDESTCSKNVKGIKKIPIIDIS